MNTIEMRHITKTFPGVKALDDITFDVRPGEVHVLLGENGAGKSTLMKILSGAYEPDEGSIGIEGKIHARLTPRQSGEAGISIIYQELSVINELSIMENIFIGKMLKKKLAGLSVIDTKTMAKRTAELLEMVGLPLKPSAVVGTLSISEKQMVEIAKAVAFNAKVIIMDEPTSSLTGEEVNKLFAIIRRLKDEGRSIVYISHKMEEIMAIGDRVTVLKDGTVTGTHEVGSVTSDELVTMMVGRELKDKYQSAHEFHEGGRTVFEVKHLTRKDNYVKDISFALKEGEVLGFSGLMGAGRSELMCAIFGADPISSGEILLDGTPLRIKSPYDALKAGLGLVTENRRETGISQNFSIQRNINLCRQLKAARLGGMWGLIDNKKDNEVAEQQRKDLQVKCVSVDQNITQLSGGNQQKAILGKWMAAGVKLLIFDEPTRGIDVGTKAEIYKLIRRLVDMGIGVIIVSSELPELLAVCDRIIVVAEGRIAASFTAAQASEEKLVRAATGNMGQGEVNQA